jgi:hypothetical protein
MQEIVWNFYSMIKTLFAVTNAVPCLFVALRVYRKNPDLIINRLFSHGLGLLALALAIFPIGSLLWNEYIFGVQTILITMRLTFLFGYIAIILVCWCSRILYDGEATWNMTQNRVFFGAFLLAHIFGLLTPDAIYVVTGPPETEVMYTDEGLLFSLVAYPCTAMLIIITLVTFWKAYSDFHREDPIIGRQALALAIGYVFCFIALIMGFLSLTLHNVHLTLLVFAFMTVGVVVMSFGFEQDAGLLRLRIASELRRMIIALTKGRTVQAEAQLMYLKKLIARERSDASTVRMLVLEAMIRIHQSKLVPAKAALEKARSLADDAKLTGLLREIDKHLEHLKVHETAAMISESVQAPMRLGNEIDDLDRALAYLDEMISIRETDNESAV